MADVRWPNSECNNLMGKRFEGTQEFKCPRCRWVFTVTTPAYALLTRRAIVNTK